MPEFFMLTYIIKVMLESLHKHKALVLWLLPSWGEFFSQGAIAILTAILANLSFINSSLSVPSDFHAGLLTANAINALLNKVLGQQVSASLASGVFFALVGLFIYVIFWLLANFSSEVGNDISVTGYVHPKGVDTQSPLRNFVSRTAFRASAALLLTFYVGLILTTLLLAWIFRYQQVVAFWPNINHLINGVLTIIAQTFALHIFIVLIRMVLLKKRLFFLEDYQNSDNDNHQ